MRVIDSFKAFREVEALVGQTLTYKALYLYNKGAVTDLFRDEDEVTVFIKEGGGEYQVILATAPNSPGIRVTCNCNLWDSSHPCVHIATALYASMLQNADSHEGGLPGMPEPEPPDVMAPLWPASPAEEVQADYRRLIVGLTVKQMRDLAARRKIPLSGLKREAILEQIVHALSRPENLATALERLSPDARRVLAFLAILGPALVDSGAPKQALAYLDAALSPWQPVRRAEQCLEDLEQMGLIFWNEEELLVPLQVLTARQPEAALFASYTGTAERVQEACPFHLTRLVMQLVLLGEGGGLQPEPAPKLGMGGWPMPAGGAASGRGETARAIAPAGRFLSQESLRGLAQATREDETQVDFAARLVEAASFWKARQPGNAAASFLKWLQDSLPGQSRGLLSLAVRLLVPLELDWAAAEGGFSLWREMSSLSHDQLLKGLALDRLRLLDLLSRAPGGQWLEIERILRVLHGLQPYLLPELHLRVLKSEKNLSCWMQVHGKRLSILDYSQWVGSFGLFYHQALVRTFSWLGLCDIAWEGSRPAAVRLTEFGEYLLGRKEAFPLPADVQTVPSLALDGEMGLRLSPVHAGAELIGLVMLLGKVRGEAKALRQGAHEPVFDVHVDGLERAFAAGWSLERVRALLEQGLARALPEKIASLIQTAAERYGRLRIYTEMALLEFSDDYCLPELLANTGLNQILLHTFSPRIVAVRPDGIAHLVEELRAKGYTPRLEDSAHG
jgi:hypothetical protein